MTKRPSFMTGTAMALLAAAALAPATAHATSSDGGTGGINSTRIERVQPLRLADVVVNGAPAPAPAPAPQPVAVPVAPAPAPIVEEPAHRSETTVVEHEQHNYMSTIAVSALMGGVAGALVGGSLYYLADNQSHAGRIGYWAAGGVLVGSAVGLTQVIVQESRVDRATATLPSDPVPTFRLALATAHF